jgi:hypothetical protein
LLVKTAPFQSKPFIFFVPPIQQKTTAGRGHVSLPHDACRYQGMNAWHSLDL